MFTQNLKIAHVHIHTKMLQVCGEITPFKGNRIISKFILLYIYIFYVMADNISTVYTYNLS